MIFKYIKICNISIYLEYFGPSKWLNAFLQYAEKVWPGSYLLQNPEKYTLKLLAKKTGYKEETVKIINNNIHYFFSSQDSLLGLAFLVNQYIQKLLIQEHSYYFHSSAIAKGNSCILIAGEGGVGKSKIADTLDERESINKISNEYSVVNVKNKKAFFLFGTPGYLLNYSSQNEIISEIQVIAIIFPFPTCEPKVAVRNMNSIRKLSKLIRYSSEVLISSHVVLLKDKLMAPSLDNPYFKEIILSDMKKLNQQLIVNECFGNSLSITNHILTILSDYS